MNNVFKFEGNVFSNDRDIMKCDRSAKSDLVGIAKSIDPGQPAQSAQADHGRYFSLLADFLCIK